MATKPSKPLPSPEGLSSQVVMSVETWTQHVVDRAVSAVSKKISRVGDCIDNLGGRVAKLEGKLSNGFEARVKLIERMQWWQLSIMVLLVGILVGGLWYMAQASAARSRETQAMLLEHMRSSSPPALLPAQPSAAAPAAAGPRVQWWQVGIIITVVGGLIVAGQYLRLRARSLALRAKAKVEEGGP
jgi:hypothetical protein